MKKIGLIIAVLVVFMVSCKKNDNNAPNTGAPLKFISLTTSDTTIAVNGVTTLTAVATGDGLTYTWSSLYGTIIGSGAVVQWTVCHADHFKIICEVMDVNNNTAKDSVFVNVK
jgi:hypothetical protein